MGRVETLRDEAVDLIKRNPEGLRYSELVKELHNLHPDFPIKDFPASIWDLDKKRNAEIYKPTRGLFKYRFSKEPEGQGATVVLSADREVEKVIKETPPLIREQDFYTPFADWLKNNLGECSEAVALGGSYLGKKWGTPDVIGIYKPSIKDIVKFQAELISAEIKINPADPVTAFGQAIAYRLFSSKVYLAEPATMIKEDLDRIEALCVLFGIGLILFDLNSKEPNFRIRVRAQRHEADMFFLNEFVNRLLGSGTVSEGFFK